MIDELPFSTHTIISMPMAKFVKCDCGYVWVYYGASQFRTTCPHCHKTVYFQKHEIGPGEFELEMKKQLTCEYQESIAEVEKLVRERTNPRANA